MSLKCLYTTRGLINNLYNSTMRSLLVTAEYKISELCGWPPGEVWHSNLATIEKWNVENVRGTLKKARVPRTHNLDSLDCVQTWEGPGRDGRRGRIKGGEGLWDMEREKGGGEKRKKEFWVVGWRESRLVKEKGEWYETSVMDSEVGAPDEPEAHAVPIISSSPSLALLPITFGLLCADEIHDTARSQILTHVIIWQPCAVFVHRLWQSKSLLPFPNLFMHQQEETDRQQTAKHLHKNTHLIV